MPEPIQLQEADYWRYAALTARAQLADLQAKMIVGQAHAKQAEAVADIATRAPGLSVDAVYHGNDATCTLTPT